MKRFIKFCLMALAIGALTLSVAPLRSAAQGTPPPAPLAQGVQPLNNVDVLTMPAVDREALLAQDAATNSKDVPPRFATALAVQVSPQSQGNWETSRSGEQVWRLRIQSEGAISLNLGFTRYWMPEGGRLFLYSPDYQQVRGPFTAADNEAHGQLWSPIIQGNEIVIEVDLPAAEVSALQLGLTSVNHGYRTLREANQPMSGACNLDVVCSAANGYSQVDPWREEIRSSGVYTVGGTWTCSGALINNTAQDLKPYFLTANHCSVNSGNAASVVMYWNFENSTCRPPGSPASGAAGDGQLTQFNTGAIWHASYAASDFTLIEMDDPINPAFNPFWSGWDRRDQATTNAIGIHHPNCDEKRISFEDDATSITSYLQTAVPGDSTHIRITDWDLGTTEPGSSGSPLYSPEHRIIGQLHGGYAACGNDSSDWYGRFYASWTGGGASTSRLRDWLDPLNTGVTTLDGRNIVESSFTLDVQPGEAAVCAPAGASYVITATQEVAGYIDPVTLSVAGVPTGASSLFSLNPVIPGGPSSTLTVTPGSAAAGAYDLDVVGSAVTQTVTTTVKLNLYTAAPGLATLVAPADGATNQSFLPTFQWSGATQGNLYSLELDQSPLFDSPIASVQNLDTLQYSLGTPLQGGQCYWWRVTADNACGLGQWADPFHFSTSLLQVVFYDEIEAGTANWTHSATPGTDHWAVSTTQAHSATHSWFVPDDNVVTDSSLRLANPVAIGGGSSLTFWHRYQFEGSAWDGAVLEISTNGGSTWTDLGSHITANGYNGTISNQYSNPLSNRQGWTGDLTTWTQVSVDLGSYAGQNVLVRWRLGCDSSSGDTGWYIDDVQITAPQAPNPAPTLTAVTPDNGSAYANTPIQVTGTHFVGSPALKLGDTWLISTTLVNSTTLEAVVPMGMTGGLYDLTVYNGDCQSATLADAYTVVTQCQAPSVALASDSPALAETGMYFTATVTGTPPITYTWDFGGNGTGVGLDTATPVFTYTTPGTYTVTVTVSNACGTDADSLGVAVLNNPPTLSDFSDQTLPVNQSTGPITFTIGDVETPVASLTVEGTSSNQTLIPDSAIQIAGTGATRTVTITPAAGLMGSAVITITVGDGTDTVSKTFTVTVIGSKLFLPILVHNYPQP